MLQNGTPIIALTLRYDRLDHFWFSLLHELGHVILHLFEGHDCIIDDADTKTNEIEKAADEFARKALLPARSWANCTARQKPSSKTVREFAKKHQIHPAIVAGRIRHERRNYQILNNLLGHRSVSKYFPNLAEGEV